LFRSHHTLGSTRALRTHHFRIHHRSLWAKTTHWSDCRSLRAKSSHHPRSNISSMRPKTAHHSWTSHWTVMMSTATTRSMWPVWSHPRRIWIKSSRHHAFIIVVATATSTIIFHHLLVNSIRITSYASRWKSAPRIACLRKIHPLWRPVWVIT